MAETGLTVLGSGNAEHHPDRASAGHLLRTPEPILLDLGPGTWRNLARAGVDPVQVRAILISHLHADHFSDIIPFLFYMAWHPAAADRPPLLIAGPPGTEAAIYGLRAAVPYLDRHPFPIETREMESGEVRIGPALASPAIVPHVDDLTALCWRVRMGGKLFAYSGDCRAGDETTRALHGADLAVVEATVPDDFPHPVHMTIGQTCETAREAGVKRLVVAHLSRRWEGRDPVAEAAGRFPGPIQAAADLVSVDF